jgi:DNA-binding LacI/PurR family transcriptional regulator
LRYSLVVPTKTTMADIAKLAGVSTSAVSLALNGRVGVSETTRERIVKIAADLGWFPNVAARALSGAQVSAVGIVLSRPPRSLGVEPFYMSFLSGLETQLSTVGTSLLMHIVSTQDEEIATYRRWAAESRVDGLVLLDLRVNDPRPPVVREIGVPTVVVGDPRYAGGVPAAWTADAEAIRTAVHRFAELGHRHLARVSERSDMAHSTIRTQAFIDACAELDLPTPYLVEADASGDSGREQTRALLTQARRPTAIQFDNDVMAVAALGAVREAGLSVPEDISLLAYDDSLLCEITHPPLSALSHDVFAYGKHVAQLLQRTIQSPGAQTDELNARPALIERGSTGPAPRRGQGEASGSRHPKA